MNLKSDCVIVTESNLPTGIIYKSKRIIYNINFWHKFIVSNSDNVPRNVILRAILDHVHPLDLIPVSFDKEKLNSYFLARNCGAAIEKLSKDNLTVPNPNSAVPFKITIILKFATTAEFKIDVQKNISTVLTKRYNVNTKTLNLSNFHEDQDLSEFCPLSQPKIMFFILHISKNLVPTPEKYILSNNRIRILNPMEALVGGKFNYLDLRNNLLDNIGSLSSLNSFTITELSLTGNPLCEKYTQPYDYIGAVKEHCKKIEILDDVVLKEGSFPTISTNFLCTHAGYDLVSQFLEHYFTLYDSKNRQLLESVYHKNAKFSLTSIYYGGQMSSATAQLRHYNIRSRNILRLADFSRNSEYLFRGSFQIMKVLSQLPPTEHDPFSFKVDLTCYSEKCAIVSINGVFKELPENLLDPEKVLGFSRTFVIQMSKEECLIVNEQLHVYNALSVQTANSFNVVRPLPMDLIPQAQNAKEQQQLADTLKIITNLNTDWSKKCLEECNFNLKGALELFMDLYKVDKIPLEGYIHPKT